MSLDPRGGLSGLLVQLAAPSPGSGVGHAPSPRSLAAAAEIVDRSRRDWSRTAGAVSAVLRGARQLGSRERRAAGDLVWDVVRARRLLELLLGVPDAGARSETLVRAAAVLFNEAPSSLLPSDAVDAFADPRHALLGHVLHHDPPAPTALGLATSLPDWFAARLIQERSPADASALARSLLARAPLTLRVHRDRTDRDAVVSELADAGIVATPSPWAPDALLLQGHANVEALPVVLQGRASVQDVGSQIVAALLAEHAGDCVIDACAGAGGKSLALLSLGVSSVLACDVRPEALAEATRRAQVAGVAARLHPILLSDAPGLPHGVAPDSAAAVLIDAPCTGSGALRREPAARWSRPPTELLRLPPIQRAILDRFAPAVRPGGSLVYATCSLFAAENEEVVASFLASRPDFALVPMAEALGRVGFDPRLASGSLLRLTPHEHGSDGFFAAVLRRNTGA